MASINDTLTLPCGVVLPNRLCKAAMTEGIADEWNRATEGHCKLYREWSRGGTGTLITGNVQVDRRFMERPGNVAIDGQQNQEQRERLKAWAVSGKAGGSRIFVQLSHGGRQSTKLVNTDLVGPSAVALDEPNPELKLRGGCTIRELGTEDIQDVINRFVSAAKVCKDCGFDGVQFHAAHGYLLSSFLNPRANRRVDEYGGSLENRARVILEIVKATRKIVGKGFPIAVKLNSADFQKGGFTVQECTTVVGWLENAGVDLIELSGGNYEMPVMVMAKSGHDVFGKQNSSTVAREGFFLEFAKEATATVSKSCIMVTGGFRSVDCMNHALENGDCDIIGIGRPLCAMLDASEKLLAGTMDRLPAYEHLYPLHWMLWPLYWIDFGRKLEFFQQMCWYYENFISISKGGGVVEFGGLMGTWRMRNYDIERASSLRGMICNGHYTRSNL